jgi:protein-S-isoprenylcysteine O-methyltransferase Ste14
MDRVLTIRLISLYAPVVLAVLASVVLVPARRVIVSAALATAWNVPALLLVNVIAVQHGWWSFAPSTVALLGVPLDLLFGWVILWGALPALVAPRLPLSRLVAVLIVIDLVAMPLMRPVVTLGPSWLRGEIVAAVVALLPSQLFARWTLDDRHVARRAAMQTAVFSALVLWMLPTTIFAYAPLGGSWSTLLDHWRSLGGIHLQLTALPALMGAAAVQEFARRGRGTPIPFDPPRRLVTSGPYAYVANPMQLSMALVLTAWGLILGNVWVVLAGPMAVVYGLGLASSDERLDLGTRFGAAWCDYRRVVREWLPCWRPFHGSQIDASIPPARLYVAETCGQCSEVAHWFSQREPRGLEIVPAETHPERDLVRITYDPRDGNADEQGVAAIARALEHIHLGWAMLGWLIRLPGLVFVLQLIVDASGGEARPIRRCDIVGARDGAGA